MNLDLLTSEGVEAAVDALEKDLLAPTGPAISTMRNHNFAILLYPPRDEYKTRARINRLVKTVEAEGWGVHSIALHQLVLQRFRALEGEEGIASRIDREKRNFAKDPDRALVGLKQQLSELIDGEEGLAKDVAQSIETYRAQNPHLGDRILVVLARAGALYPFVRSSALLKKLGGKTHNLPVVLLYPGKRHENGGLSFMEELAPDSDYRPRIYA
ncbi:MAG: DUF1788 domain-containing protein [Myxococcota bacterium]|nr:DUF1788 domain-containing protein [Myxococcota bacterium]